MVKQITVFLENSEGRLSALCRCLGDAGVSMKALTIAETSEYGLIRIIADDPQNCVKVLTDGGFHASLTDVTAIEVPNRAGGLADLLDKLADLDLNIEYGYCFSTEDDRAVDVLKIKGGAKAAEAVFALEAAGFRVLKQDEL